MKDRFLFFDFKRSKLLNILIIIQVALWLFYVAALVSLIKFDDSYRNRYNRSLPMDNGQLMVFYKMMLKDNAGEMEESNLKELKSSLDYLEKNNYKYGMLKREENKYIPSEVLGIKIKNMKPKFNRTKERYDEIYPIYMSWNMVNNYMSQLKGEITKDDWKEDQRSIPVILGSSFSNKAKVGDRFQYEGKEYVIKGFFKRDILAFDYTNVVDSSFLLNDCFVIPLDKNKYIENFGYEPISIYLNKSQVEDIDKLINGVKEVSPNIVIKSFYNDLDEFLEELRSKRIFETIRILIVSLIATASIVTTIFYKILSNKDRIGILFSVGISKKKIFKMLSTEFLTYVASGIIVGSLFYLKNCKEIYAFFINEDLLLNLYIAMGVIIVIVMIVLLIGFNKVNKLSPKEMVGGFKE